MGMYTELNGRVILGASVCYCDSLAGVMLNCIKKGGEYEEVAKNFIRLPRWDMISIVDCSIVDWGDGRAWQLEIEADMKNYNGEVEMFFDKVLPLIALDWEISVQYVEWAHPMIATRDEPYDPSKAVWEDY